mmetsp:Transcript_31610/g.35451  ORF Transcript_31610/g.35451 Transcript_31610/m.35451 type:complete len:80 (+) Transcript_31610:56-295(+)
MMQQEQEELHSAYCSNQYGYHDLCECDSSPSATTELLDIDIDDFTTSCCIMDTSFDTAETIPLGLVPQLLLLCQITNPL